MPTHKSEDYKLYAVEYYYKTQKEVCKIFKCSARSLLRWVDKYNENGEIKRHNRKPVVYKVHKNQVKFILDETKKSNCYLIKVVD
jgi:transposase